MANLQFYWYQATPGHEAADLWGQLASGAHRLVDIREELESVARSRNVQRGLKRLTYHVEGYLGRAFELRERALTLLASRTKRNPESVRHSAPRLNALADLAETDPSLSARLLVLLELLERERDLRNAHTHHHYLRLGLLTESDLYDPDDALADADSRTRQQLEPAIRREIHQLAAKYAKRCTEAWGATWAVLGALHSD